MACRLVWLSGLLLIACDSSPRGPACDNDSTCEIGSACTNGHCQEQPGAELGAPCSRDEDCSTGTCKDDVCTVECASESFCPEGFSCQLRPIDSDDDGFPEEVIAWCLAPDAEGRASGSGCHSGEECQTGWCAQGVCADRCEESADCAEGLSCVEAAVLDGGFARLAGDCSAVPEVVRLGACLSELGTFEVLAGPFDDGDCVVFDVPGDAASIMLYAFVDESELEKQNEMAEKGKEVDLKQFLGLSKLESPSGQLLFEEYEEQVKLFQQPVRYLPAFRNSAMLVPNTPDLNFETGLYCAEIRDDGGLRPEISLTTKTAPDGEIWAGRLDINFYFMNLEGRGCGVDDLNAKTASSHGVFASVLSSLESMLGQANISLGETRYYDRLTFPDVDVVDPQDSDEMADLFSLGTGSEGYTLDVFVVRGMVGLLGFAFIPNPPGKHAVAHAGAVISTSTACADALGAVTAHEVGHALGLFHNVELGITDPETGDPYPDPIEDTDGDNGNLMYPGGGGLALTAGQSFVLRRHANVVSLPGEEVPPPDAGVPDGG